MLTKWRTHNSSGDTNQDSSVSVEDEKSTTYTPRKWNLGVLGDPYTDEVPGSVILLSSAHQRNEPLGLQHVRERSSTSSLPSPLGSPRSQSVISRNSSRSRILEKKRTKDGKFILEPQPDESANDPLNWPALRRDIALLSLGFYCMVGGGMTPILAAGFHNVAETYDVSVPQVALTTGLYMLGLGIGSVIASPTAILFGKRPVYLMAIILFLLSAVWCALSPNYASLVVARIVQGLAVSPVECLPSATIAEIFFLHERAYRLGVYTLLLLGGKNLIPLVAAAIIQSLGWRWVFWMVAIVVGFSFFLIFFFVPETFWDRTPRKRKSKRARSRSPGKHHRHFRHPFDHRQSSKSLGPNELLPSPKIGTPEPCATPSSMVPSNRRHKNMHVGFADDAEKPEAPATLHPPRPTSSRTVSFNSPNIDAVLRKPRSTELEATQVSGTPASDYFNQQSSQPTAGSDEAALDSHQPINGDLSPTDLEKHAAPALVGQTLASARSSVLSVDEQSLRYTDHYRSAPPKSYIHSLRPWNGRLAKDKWHKVMMRPFILFAYPAVLWSSMVYALAVGWLIVLSESVSSIYQNRESYSFTSFQVGLVYLSPFIGGVLGTAVAGKVSDLIVQYMARKNDGVYEPEFRLVMAIPIAISTTIGLMGFGWSAEERDAWIVPTIFFGVISFGCSLASTTAVTFVVDSYRVYAGEALVTLNLCKNILHGFIFSLFFTHWLESDGSKKVFLAVGGIQLGCLLFSIPMYIFGKQARMWTVRKNFMEKF
ncbi:MFS general substrate transporter [Delitschia confertaspora ATCC 74209]|uniref:MFS general substrate transporter n=1 Tax=Delitschia confertaspora ATCC 74209 TaxID=1513339 RepID=A0A9P4JF89_9PLEO|nr:MFS general substrate transporter [Delitschia confertaspora ATCC 74209]